MRFRIEYLGIFAVLWVTYEAQPGQWKFSERVCIVPNPPRNLEVA